MPRKTIVLVLLAVTAAFASALLIAPPEAQAGNCRCMNQTLVTSVHEGRSETSCTEADNLAIGAAIQEANGTCAPEGRCGTCTNVEVTACSFDGWDYVSEWKHEFHCLICP